jgi:dipeptidyl aminopeptidase/acylaminoacyl peptidase
MPLAEPIYPPLEMPDSVQRETVTIWSNGVALDGDIYRPRVAAPAAPAVVLCHGWGGSKLTCERHAALFAASGIIALTFTQATWFGSGPRLWSGAGPDARAVRDLVDPADWLQNYLAAIDYLEGEPGVDTSRIGAWGTSFGGGIAMHCAANDARIRALSVQVANVAPLAGPRLAHAKRRATDMARGAYDPVAEGFDVVPGLAGFGNFAKWTHYDPLRQLDRLSIPTLMMDAGDEEMFAIADNAGRAYEILKDRPDQIAHYEVIPGIDHYGIYFDGYDQSSRMALDWFTRHLGHQTQVSR